MAISPLLKNAFDSLEHALEHYLLNSERDRKFAILHADQAVELILKERVRIARLSIFRRDRRTSIGMHEALRILAETGTVVQERADLELLHDERNRIQHHNSTPNEDTATFHIENAVKFAHRFLPAELDVDLRRAISASLYERLEAFWIDEGVLLLDEEE